MSRKANSPIVVQNDRVKLTEADVDRFWSKVNKNGPLPDQSNPHYLGLDQCWEWMAYCFTQKVNDRILVLYGCFKADGKNWGAHRISFLLERGQFPVNGQCCHKCDNSKCVNPSHLFDGTTQENTQDRHLKGRTASGDRNGSRKYPERLPRGENHHSFRTPEVVAKGNENGNSKLTEDKIREIRYLYKGNGGGLSQETLGKMFGVRQTNISQIVNRITWRHV